jgi:hypothetical protein
MRMSNFVISSFFLLAGLLLITEINGFIPPDTLKRFEYKVSFKGPHLVFKDGMYIKVMKTIFHNATFYYNVKRIYSLLGA